jgi:hypothetical protein
MIIPRLFLVSFELLFTGLHLMSRSQLVAFFTACHKDAACDAVSGLIDQLVKQQEQQEQQEQQQEHESASASQRDLSAQSPVLMNVCVPLIEDLVLLHRMTASPQIPCDALRSLASGALLFVRPHSCPAHALSLCSSILLGTSASLHQRPQLPLSRSNAAAKKAWVERFFSNQLHGITTAALLMEIGGLHAVSGPRNLSRVVDVYAGDASTLRPLSSMRFSQHARDSSAGKPHTLRDMLTWLFWTCSNIADLPTLPRIYKSFVDRRDSLLRCKSTAELRGFPIDLTFTRVIAGEELKCIENQIRGGQPSGSLNAMAAARLLKARSDIVVKYLGVCIDDQDLASRLCAYIDSETHAACWNLVSDATPYERQRAQALSQDIQEGRYFGLLASLTKVYCSFSHLTLHSCMC